MSDNVQREAWRNWTLDEVFNETEKILSAAEYPPNASFSPMALHYYREGFLLELRHRGDTFATTWLSEHDSKDALIAWAIEQAKQFVKVRKEQKRKLLRRRLR